MSNGRRQPSRGGTSRMTRECQVRICERLGVKFPGPTRHSRRYRRASVGSRHVCFAPIAPGFVQGANERQTGKSRQADKGEVTSARAANQYGFCPHTVTRWP